MKESEYFFEWYYNFEKSEFEKMISKKDFDDFVERSKILPTEKMFYRTFLTSEWKDGT